MGLSGKYDFPGIKKVGTAVLKAVLAGTGWGAQILASPFRGLFETLMGFAVEWLANKGLLIINIGFIYVEGELDQKAFDKAFDDALSRLKTPGLSDPEKKKIDDKIIKAFRDFARIGPKPV